VALPRLGNHDVRRVHRRLRRVVDGRAGPGPRRPRDRVQQAPPELEDRLLQHGGADPQLLHHGEGGPGHLHALTPVSLSPREPGGEGGEGHGQGTSSPSTEITREKSNEEDSVEDAVEDALEDDRLRLIFTCCHPSLPPEAHVALTLREVCGLTTEEIARAFLVTPATLAQRIVRAKAKIRETRIPYEVPSPQELPVRLGAVLHVIYLVFNEGYSAAAGREVTRAELTGEAIRLGRLLAELQADSEALGPEVIGLLSLMLLQESRHAARTSPTGELILLENQDRSLWNREQIAEGVALLEKALKSHRFGAYTLQAAIAAVHAEAQSTAVTDWRQIVALYDRLLRIHPSPVVQLNRAVAVAMSDGPEIGLKLIDALLEDGELANYYLAHSARADMYRRLGRTSEARSSYEKALALTQQEPERQFLQERIRQLN